MSTVRSSAVSRACAAARQLVRAARALEQLGRDAPLEPVAVQALGVVQVLQRAQRGRRRVQLRDELVMRHCAEDTARSF